MVSNHIYIIIFLFLYLHYFFSLQLKKNHIAVAHLTRYWSKLTLWLGFVFPVVEWEEKINTKEQYIFCANHVSSLDIPLILVVLPVPIQYIGKAEIARIPIFGYFYKNSVTVNRQNKKNSYSAFLEAGSRLKAGLNICIFPEEVYRQQVFF